MSANYSKTKIKIGIYAMAVLMMGIVGASGSLTVIGAQFPSASQSLIQSINEFLKGQKELYQIVFIQKYWYFLPVERIAEQNEISKSKTLSILHRMRQKLKVRLRKEGYHL